MKQLVRPVDLYTNEKATLVCHRGDRPSEGMLDVVIYN